MYDRLFFDDRENGFLERLTDRWNELRNDWLTQENIIDMLQTNVDFLTENGVYEREICTWEDFSLDETSLEYSEEWLGNRLDYLDQMFNNTDLLTSSSDFDFQNIGIEVFPNPANDFFILKLDEIDLLEKMTLYNMFGQPVQTYQNISTYNIFSTKDLPTGQYFIHLNSKKQRLVQPIFIAH